MSTFFISKREYDGKFEVLKKVLDPALPHGVKQKTIECINNGYYLPSVFIWVTVAVVDTRKEAFKFIKGKYYKSS